ncbi:unnamed protein product [Miscanthus lutarioriparius]|uniref:Uncharacterized protein n=1 Tax=Miscanthus lutarioriparius TaxID=422564 RepID=A0A811PGG5_9POAL|nr:unnamed protein product [Miscanthus lutarioriparius]
MVEPMFASQSEHIAEPKAIDETSVMQVELATSTGDECAAEGDIVVSSETVVESEPVQETVVPSQGGSIETNTTSTISEVNKDTESRASGEVCKDAQSHGGESYTELQLAPSSGEEAMILCRPVNEESAPRAENAKTDEADTEQQLPPSAEAMVDVSSELLSQDEKVAPSTGPLGNDEDAQLEEAAAAQRELSTEVAHGSENAKAGTGRDRGIDTRRPGQAWEVQHRGKEGPWAGGCSLGLVKMSSGSRFTASWDAAGTAQREGVARRGGSGGRRRGGFVRSRGFGSPSVAWIRRGACAGRSWAGIGCWAGVGSKFGSLFFAGQHANEKNRGSICMLGWSCSKDALE